CGNGLRCVAKYVYEHNIVNKKQFFIETKAGIVEAFVDVNENKVESITIDMGKPILQRSLIPMAGTDVMEVISEPFEINNESLFITAVSMGNPHAVFFVENIEEAPLYELGPIISKDVRFPDE